MLSPVNIIAPASPPVVFVSQCDESQPAYFTFPSLLSFKSPPNAVALIMVMFIISPKSPS